MIEAIIASTLTVYVLLAVFALVLLVAAYNDSMSFAFGATVVGLVALQIFSHVDPWGYVKENPKDIVFWAIMYFPVGIGWSFFRWWRILKDKAAKLREEKATWSPSKVGWIKTWEEHVKANMPRADRNKSAITCWITYWPFSLLGYLFVDILCDIGNWIYSLISGTYQRLADRVAKSLWEN